MKYADAIRANDFGDVLVGRIEKGESSLREDRAGQASPGALRSPPSGDHRISQDEGENQ